MDWKTVYQLFKEYIGPEVTGPMLYEIRELRRAILFHAWMTAPGETDYSKDDIWDAFRDFKAREK